MDICMQGSLCVEIDFNFFKVKYQKVKLLCHQVVVRLIKTLLPPQFMQVPVALHPYIQTLAMTSLFNFSSLSGYHSVRFYFICLVF